MQFLDTITADTENETEQLIFSSIVAGQHGVTEETMLTSVEVTDYKDAGVNICANIRDHANYLNVVSSVTFLGDEAESIRELVQEQYAQVV